jgi:hypothetical protein
VESTVAQVMILNGFGEGGFYKMVTWAGLKILEEFEGPRDRGAWLTGARTQPVPD